MRRYILTIVLVLISFNAYSQSFTIDDKGIVKCTGANPGDKGTINGVTYEAVDRELLVQRRDQNADLSKVCTSLVTDMRDLFANKQNFNLPIGNWDVSNVTDMRGMFRGYIVESSSDTDYFYNNFNQPIGNWEVSSVTDMQGMFYLSHFNQPIGNWEVSSVTDMQGMFYLSQFNQPIGNWDVSSVTDMGWMFENSKFNQPIGNWDVSSVTTMSEMFRQSQFNQPIGNWDVSSVTNMSQMFYVSRFNQSIEGWDVSSVTDMGSMFQGARLFNQPIGNWDVSSVTNMGSMFGGSQFNQPIGNWDVSSVTNMRFVFSSSPFNQPIGNWDVSSVAFMFGMFLDSQFNHPINRWCVTQIQSEPTYFATNSPLTTENKPIWGKCPNSTNLENGTVTDIDGKVYSTIQIGNQQWMAQNLRTSRFNDGTVVPEITLENPTAWSTDKSGAWSFYDDDSENNSPYGKLYNFYVVDNEKNICPTGWSVPSETDWSELIEFLGDTAGRKLKSDALWYNNGNGTNESGFDAVGAGRKGASGTSYTDLNRSARFWTSSEYNVNNAIIYRLTYDSDEIVRDFNSKNNAFSIRCVFDIKSVSIENSTLTIPSNVELLQNYPNPFNPTTQIRFALPESQQVTIRVYDVNGRMITELVNNQTYSAGNHQVTFDGSGLSSGIYIYTLTTNNGMWLTRKLLLVK